MGAEGAGFAVNVMVVKVPLSWTVPLESLFWPLPAAMPVTVAPLTVSVPLSFATTVPAGNASSLASEARCRTGSLTGESKVIRYWPPGFCAPSAIVSVLLSAGEKCDGEA